MAHPAPSAAHCPRKTRRPARSSHVLIRTPLTPARLFRLPLATLTSCFRPAILVVVGAAMSLTAVARAQWTVTNLHPSGATQSQAFGVSDAGQVGNATISGIPRASLWSGTAVSRVTLHPAGASASQCLGASGTRQVGAATISGVARASLWTGTAACLSISTRPEQRSLWRSVHRAHSRWGLPASTISRAPACGAGRRVLGLI